MSPISTLASAGQTFTLNVAIDPQQYGITAGDVEISFDPAVLEGIDIQPGLLMGSDVIMAKRTIDNTNGKLRLAVGREGALPVWSIPTSEGTIAEAELKVRDGTSPQTVTVTISFIGLANQNFEDVPGIITSSATVKVQ